MNLYLAKKDNVSFYIQKEQIADYESLGYDVYVMQPVPVTIGAKALESEESSNHPTITEEIPEEG